MNKGRLYSFAGMPAEYSAVMQIDEFADIRSQYSSQQLNRRSWEPELPAILASGMCKVIEADEIVELTCTKVDEPKLLSLFPKLWGQKVVTLKAASALSAEREPLKVGVVLSGGQAPGGHNVIAGLYDQLKTVSPRSQLIGFLNGPQGVFTHKYREINGELMNRYRNMGGFDMICSGRHKIETDEQKRKSMEICQNLGLQGLVVVGGDDSNTNAAVLAEYFKENGCETCVIGVPKTIDGDLKNEFIEISFGFDTACRTYSELIGNLCVDAETSRDRYHFVRLMGRSASNIALECALQTRPNLTFIGEEIRKESRSLKSICDEICDLVIARDRIGRSYGVILLPEGLIEFIPEFGVLISELNEILANNSLADVEVKLGPTSLAVFRELPNKIRNELCLERDSHGNVQVAKIALESLLIEMVSSELSGRNFHGRFIPAAHYFGYEGRCAIPSNFDARYCYALGNTAGCLVENGVTGYMAVVRNLKEDHQKWIPGGCPIIMMMNIERRKGKEVPVIQKYLVELDKPLFNLYNKVKEAWKMKDYYRNPGPIQYQGCAAETKTFLITYQGYQFLPENEICKLSPLECSRLRYRSPKSSILTNLKTRAVVAKRCNFGDCQTERFIRRAYPLQCDRHGNRAYSIEPCDTPMCQPLRIGVVLCGQPIPGANNILHGLYERVQMIGGNLLGFKGITGLLKGIHVLVDDENIDFHVNQAGFRLLTRTPETKKELRNDSGLAQVAHTCKTLQLDGLVMIGGQTSLTDAAVFTEYLLQHGITTNVVGVPANQENNIKHHMLEAAIGFDTTSKVYSTLIGNLLTDAASATKYWYFVRLMGNVPSHIALETALQTHPNFTVISEKYVDENMSLRDIVRDIADLVVIRSKLKKNFGTVVIPEGVIRAIPQFKTLLDEIDGILITNSQNQLVRDALVNLDGDSQYFKMLSPWSAALLQTLPTLFRSQLVKETPTGQIELSEIAAEQLIAEWVGLDLEERKKNGQYSGTFSPVCHYFGFQGRSAMPSNFDCALATAHGYVASILVESGLTGFVTSVRGLCNPPTNWRFSALPISVLLKILPDIEGAAYGRRVPMVPCADVDLNDTTYRTFQAGAELVRSQCEFTWCVQWDLADSFCNPGSIQFEGTSADYYNRTLYEEQHDYISMLAEIESLLRVIGGICSFGVKKDILKNAVTSMGALSQILSDSLGPFTNN